MDSADDERPLGRCGLFAGDVRQTTVTAPSARGSVRFERAGGTRPPRSGSVGRRAVDSGRSYRRRRPRFSGSLASTRGRGGVSNKCRRPTDERCSPRRRKGRRPADVKTSPRPLCDVVGVAVAYTHDHAYTICVNTKNALRPPVDRKQRFCFIGTKTFYTKLHAL